MQTILVTGAAGFIGSNLVLELLLESVMEGVLVSGTVSAHASGECVRCLDDVERELGVPVIPVAQDGYELLDAMCGLAAAPPDFKPNLPEDEYYRYNPGTR